MSDESESSLWKWTKVGGKIVYGLSPVSSVVDVYEGIKEGDYGKAALGAVTLIPVGKLAKLGKLARVAKEVGVAEKVAKDAKAIEKGAQEIKALEKGVQEANAVQKGAQEAKALEKGAVQETKAAERAEETAAKSHKNLPDEKPGVCQKCEEAKAQKKWESLSQKEKRLKSERIGEEAMQQKAEELGYEDVLKPSEASKRPQGFDGVYRDPKGRRPGYW